MTIQATETQILLIEDNPADAELTMDALCESHLDNQIMWLKDGAEAIDFIFGEHSEINIQRVRLVLLDLQLPRINGLDVLRRIRSEELTRRLPVAVLTSSREESDVVRAYDLGINSYLVKPVDSDSFMKVVKELGLYWMLLNKSPGEAK